MAEFVEEPLAPTSPQQAAEAAAGKVIAEQDAARQKAVEDAYNITDPGRPAPAPTTAPAGKQEPNQPIAGATPDGGLTPALLAEAEKAGITEEMARKTAPEVLRHILDRQRDPKPEPQQQYGPTPNQVYEAWQRGYIWNEQIANWEPYQAQQKSNLPNLREWKDDEGRELAPPIVEAFEAMQKQFEAVQRQNQELQTAQQRQMQTLAAQQSAGLKRQLEASVKADATYKDVLNDAGVKRLAVRMDSIAAEYDRAGLPPPAHDDLYTEARNSLFGSRAEQKAAEQVSAQLRNASGQFIAKPTATTRNNDLDSMPFGDARAERAVEAFQRNGFRG